MPYIRERCKAGKTKDVLERYSTRYGKKYIQRRKNVSVTPEAVKKVNERNAKKNLKRLINANFGEGDWHMTYTYKKENRPDLEGAKKDLRNLLRRLKREYEKAGVEFKYIAAIEFGKKGAVHFHVVQPYLDMRLIKKHWTKGTPRPSMMDNRKNHEELANYIIKETSNRMEMEDEKTGRRYSSSRNLIKPPVKKRKIKGDWMKEEPVADKGYYIDPNTVRSGYHERTGMYYREYTMIRLE